VSGGADPLERPITLYDGSGIPRNFTARGREATGNPIEISSLTEITIPNDTTSGAMVEGVKWIAPENDTIDPDTDDEGSTSRSTSGMPEEATSSKKY
jgi:hypothetical protein